MQKNSSEFNRKNTEKFSVLQKKFVWKFFAVTAKCRFTLHYETDNITLLTWNESVVSWQILK